MADITHRWSDEIQEIFNAMVGGARFGIKIRLPHAFVMTILFRHDLTPKQKLQSILRLALEHASNLAAFATLYKVGYALPLFLLLHVHLVLMPGALWTIQPLTCLGIVLPRQVLLASLKWVSRYIHGPKMRGQSFGRMIMAVLGRLSNSFAPQSNTQPRNSNFAPNSKLVPFPS